MATIGEVLALALQRHQAGDLTQAEQLYRQVLAVEPGNADALHLLGVLAYQVGRHDLAVPYLRQGLALAPQNAACHYHLGLVYEALRQSEAAAGCYRQALQLQPGFAEAHNHLGTTLAGQGRVSEAADSYRAAVRLRPDYAEAHSNLGVMLQQQGQPADAEACFHQALHLHAGYPQAHSNLGNLLRELGRLPEAEVHCREALGLKPDYVEALNNLGAVLQEQGRAGEAEGPLREALRLRPDYVEAHYNLGNLLTDLGRLDEAVAGYREALRLRPDYAGAHNNLGTALKEMGRLDEALAAFRAVLADRPDLAAFHSNLVYTLHFHPDYDAAALADEHRRWNEGHAQPLARLVQPHDNDPDPDRRLRIGYVSPDLHDHPVGRFLLPLLEAHDARSVEVFCYAWVRKTDDVTRQMRSHTDCWRDVTHLDDERLAELIRADRVDVLVDLSAHMAHNRLLVFARKPAPVQVTYLAYCSTTGLQTMDYRLTDPFLDPPGQPQPWYSEESVWLPETYWCYRPLRELPPAGPLPALTAGQVTFGCQNNFCKVTLPTLAAWRDLLGAVLGSRLLLHAHAGSHRQRVRAFFAEGGVDPGRVEFLGPAPLPEYFARYDRIDVGLDPFPYAGGTTTCDALWMGVPVISLAGQTAVARAGLSILSNAGLPELVARTPQEYVQVAAALAGDLPRLVSLRSGLRARLEHSPLTDAPRFARHVEEAFRRMWQRWCTTRERGGVRRAAGLK